MFSHISSLIPFPRERDYPRPPSSCSSRSSFSRASSVIYTGQRPFTEIAPLVFELCRNLWPDACHDATKVDQMEGGYNFRIIGLSIVHCQGSESTQYILRLPRCPNFPVGKPMQNYLDRYAAYLKFVKGNSQIPISDLVFFDLKGENVLQEQYIIHRRAAGENAYHSYLTLDHDGKCNIARELGGIYRQMQQMRSNSAGFLAPGQHEHGSSSFSQIKEFEEVDNRPPVGRRDALPELSWSEIIIEKFEREEAEAAEIDWDWMADMMGGLSRIIKEMKAFGYLDDNQNYLCNQDLSPANIIIDSTTRPTISAVLSWTDAIFAPRFMSSEPPLWLWAWNHEKDIDLQGRRCYPNDDQRKAGKIPADEKSRELKRIFDEAAGPEYVQYAYGPQYRIAREVFRKAIEGVDDSSYHYLMPILIKDWAKIRRKEERKGRKEERKRRGSFRSRMRKHFSNAANVLGSISS